MIRRFGKVSFLATLFIFVIALETHSEVIPANLLSRVVKVRYGVNVGTAFPIEKDGRQYLVSADHIFPGIKDKDKIELFIGTEWKDIKVTVIRPTSSNSDVIVFIPPSQIFPSYPVIPTMSGIFLTQEVFFIGYPFSMHLDYGDPLKQPLPFIKHGICSGIDPKSKVIYVDGHGNPGFSGGPILFKETNSDKWKVAAVVSRPTPEIMNIWNLNSTTNKYDIDTGLKLVTYAGLLQGFSIEFALEAISENPTGPKVNK